MKRAYRSLTPWIACAAVAISACTGIFILDAAKAAPHRERQSTFAGHSKVAHDLRDRQQKNAGDDNVDVIVELNGQMSPELAAMLQSSGIKIKKHFSNFNIHSLRIPSAYLDSLASFPEVEFVSADSEVKALGGHVAHTTGADDARSYAPTGGSYDGSGIGIAIIDSGIYSDHVSFLNAGTQTSRIVKSIDFTGEGRTDDPYGHGTHVAAAAAGNGVVANAKYIGIAPRANIINLRVLNAQGVGNVSSLLGALDWVLSNHNAYNIRVANMSLGLPAVSSYKNDPVCIASRKLVDAGIVVTAAAGNNGKEGNGQKIYGEIHAPGNEPSVITVGAVNTFGTDNRADDVIATYSSRGPTRSYWTDILGTKHYDNLVKPDLAAPGNKLVFAEAPNSLLLQQSAGLDAGVSSNPARKEMTLSGTSVASPLVAGAAAMMLQANPKLTPNMVKVLLMYSAQQLANFNAFEQGAGELNIDGAVYLAKLVRTDLTSSTPLGTQMLTAGGPSPQTSISYGSGNFTFAWAQGIIVGNSFIGGPSVINRYQKVYAQGVLLGDALIESNGVLLADNTKITSDVFMGNGVFISNGTTMGSGGWFLATGVLLGDGVLLADGVLLGDGVLLSDGVLLGDGVLLADANRVAYAAMIQGDSTAIMQVPGDTGTDYLGY